MEQTSSDNTVSSQKSLPSSHDSGWNDPPKWALSSQYNSPGTSTKRILNKRVAFPLSSQTVASEKSSQSPSSHMMLPTLETSATPTITTAPHKPLMAPDDKVSTTKVSESDFDKNQALTEVLVNLESMMTERKLDKNKVEEIQRRLDIMKSDWIENKLNSLVQKSILDLSKALLQKDVEQADKIHIALMMQHATVCRAWMPAVRHLIFELKNNCESSDVLKQSQPSLLPIQ